ncbi:MAG: hypothetical protein ACPG52_09345 [Cognaticolwellia sp.]
MSLSDLKKSKSGPKKRTKHFTVDEFIADAENYAQGTPQIVSSAQNERNVKQAILAAKSQDVRPNDDNSELIRRFRHATFTLSEQAIEQLQTLALDSKLAKSHILRILIDELCHQDQKDKLTRLLASKIS